MKISIIVILYVLGIMLETFASLSKNKFLGTIPVIIASLLFIFINTVDMFIFSLILVSIYFVITIIRLTQSKKIEVRRNDEFSKTIIEDL